MRAEAATPEFRIRTLRSNDLSALTELTRNSGLPAYRDAQSASALLRTGVVFGAVGEQRVLGCCSILNNVRKTYVGYGSQQAFPIPNVYLCGAYVSPDARRTGIGEALYRHRLAFAANRYGCDIVVELLGDGSPGSVHPETRAGYNFYLRHGFTSLGYSTDSDHGLVMGLPLKHATDPSRGTMMMPNVNALLTARGLTDLPNARQILSDVLLAGGHDPAVVSAMATIPRHAFAAPGMANFAYHDRYLWTNDTVLTTPSVVAAMIEAVDLNNMKRVLEIGTGTGYQTAVLGLLAAQVFSVDRVPRCVASAADALRLLGIENVKMRLGDGFEGWPDEAPFDAIIVAAAPSVVPATLVRQLNPQHGLMVVPVGPMSGGQRLLLVRRVGERITTRDLGATYFVPMVPTGSSAEVRASVR